MSASDSQSPIESLPTELLERIFLFTSVRDISRLSLVNHAFCDLILASPSIQYEVDLFDAGLQPNPRTKASLADCRAALEAYSRRWGALDPAEKWDKSLDVSTILEAVVVSGTYGILWVNSIKFFTLGSVSRGIPKREWEIPLEHTEASIFTFYPQANVVAIVEEVAWTWIIYLNTLNDGEPHPAARIKVLSYTFAPGNGVPPDILEASITGSRLALLRGLSDVCITQVAVWDWTTGQILVELSNGFYQSAKFVDDYWLALVLASAGPTASPELVLLNTEQTITGNPALAQTTFHFDPHEHLDVKEICLYLDQGGYKPSPEEDLITPFYQDASQRVIATGFHECDSVFVMKTEVLLRLARERRGMGLEWEQWKSHAVEIQPGCCVDLWVSGPRLFCISRGGRDDGEASMGVYDFSAQASAWCMQTVTDEDGRPNSQIYGLPWDGSAIYLSNGGHDSIAVLMEVEDDEDPPATRGIMHVWNF